ncbi:DegT/DnrJ/EryC1/StrS family aminotransferase [Gorillibacterium sp. sgz5001074]|uniref:DegT/DnrJ/EryC1/StrS family aminotransferase n=1 Tax=Gorillibacterium sp. sgz5001074 TaxID=3446695 RepID=UPI003F66135C
MKQPRIYLSPPHMGGEEGRYIEEAFRTNWIAPLGPHVDAFEKEVAQYVGTSSALALSSGTAAIHLALKLLKVGEGDTVFCSTLTFVASANPILYQNAIPVFIDSDPDTWNMSPRALEHALSQAKGTKKMPKAVIIVNLYGQSADMDALLEICGHYKVPVIEDAAESLGAEYKGKKSGSLGLYGIYSFNGNKIITTSGGGMLVSNDEEGLDKARFWATQARDQAVHYQHSEMGYNYRMSNVLAGIGRAQLKTLEDKVQARRRNYQIYYDELGKLPGVSFMPEASFGKSTRWLTVLMLDPSNTSISPSTVIEELAKDNIESRPVWKPLHLQPLFRDNSYYMHSDESTSDILFNQGICLPSGSSLTMNEMDRIISTIYQLFSR